MKVLLIQPPDPDPEVQSFEPDPVRSRVFGPPWNILCLRSFMMKRTRHAAAYIDCRLFSDLEKELAYSIEKSEAPICIVNTETHALGEAVSVFESIKRNFPTLYTVSFGQHPSEYPNLALVPWVDFALCGDPEPILKSFLDFIDIEPRLHRTPGLVFHGKDDRAPYWLSSLKSTSLPDWDDLYWKSYSVKRSDPFYRVPARLSRGSPGLAPDRFLGGSLEPFRILSFDRIADSLKKCSVPGLHEVFFEDPPGFWTADRIRDWCSAWRRHRTMQNWSMQMLPAVISPELARELGSSGCRRIEFVVPSCNMETLALFGCSVDAHNLGCSMDVLYECNVSSHVKFLLGGPEEPAGEHKRILQWIGELREYSYSMHPFPMYFDSRLWQDQEAGETAPTMEQWLQWAREPRRFERPSLTWGGENAAKEVQQNMARVQYTRQRSPARLFRNMLSAFKGANLVQTLEQKAGALLPKPRHPES